MNDRINSNLIDANIKLQDENNMLKTDNKMLETRIKKAIEYAYTFYQVESEEGELDLKIDRLIEILKGEVIYD